MKLMCCNNIVVDLSANKVINRALLPVYSWGVPEVYAFLERRVFAQSNKFARMLSTTRVERFAFKLGLSDSYWVCADDLVRFEDISPYYQPFGTLEFVQGFTEPTLRLMGSFDKQWERKAGIICIKKRQPYLVAQLEVKASELAALLNIGDKSSVLFGGGIDGLADTYIRNMSNPQRMLLDFGSLLTPNYLRDGLNMTEVQQMYNLVGLSNIIGSYILPVSLFDTIVGNMDRRHNQGNWGFFKSTIDGKVSLAPAYDFNLAYSMDLPEELIKQRLSFIKKSKKSQDAISILSKWKDIVYTYCNRGNMSVWMRNFDRLVTGLS